jgi:hypothetical protein
MGDLVEAVAALDRTDLDRLEQGVIAIIGTHSGPQFDCSDRCVY